MRPEITTLPNGLRVVTHAMPHLETVSLGVWVGVGARHERLREHGISHLLEHMAFKGTELRTARRIAEAIEEVGGEINAATSLEATAYYARALKGDDGVAIELIADILQNSLFAEDDLERERDVILQEIASISDSPEEIAFDFAQEAAFPDQPAGRPIIGTPASVRAISSSDLRVFLDSHYRAPSMVLTVAGAVSHDRIVRHAEAQFGRLRSDGKNRVEPAIYSGGVRASSKPFEQSHLVMGFAGPAYNDPEFFTAQVLSGVLGGGMSSRLFQEAREQRGLCYSIHSSAWALSDSGMFAIHAATGPDQMGDLIEVTVQELAKVAATAPYEAEVARAKAQLKAGLLMSLESSAARSEQMARHLLVLDRLMPPEELIERVDAVTPAAARALAECMLERAPPSVAVVGAGRRSRQLAEKAARLSRA